MCYYHYHIEASGGASNAKEKVSKKLYDMIINMDPQSCFGAKYDDCAVASIFTGTSPPRESCHDSNGTYQLASE